MNSHPFLSAFQVVTAYAPSGYQRRLAKCPCESRSLKIPTGLGKTAAAVLAWMWNRVIRKDPTIHTAANSLAK